MFKRWLRNWLLSDESEKSRRAEKYSNSVITGSTSTFDSEDHRINNLRFNVTPARGGVVLTVKHYDCKRDEDNTTVHVLHDGQDLAKDIGDIVSMELLRS
jgi:hypothetical protein